MNRLIITEGLPCSGKSTTSKFIADKLGAVFVDEGTGSHPADYEFHSFVNNLALNTFSTEEQALIKEKSALRRDGHIVPLGEFSGELFDKLLRYKIYDFLPWETEMPVMLDRWREFVKSVKPDERYVFNCVLLQNPMCETMMRFGFDTERSAAYIRSICDIISPLEPFVVYLHSSDIRSAIEKALPERGADWLNSVIDYHCNGAYGKANNIIGYDGYIKALEERQRREVEILHRLNIPYIILSDPHTDWQKGYVQIWQCIEKLTP